MKLMDERYEHYNEKTFEAYCKRAIDHAIYRGRAQKSRKARDEVSLYDLPENMLARPCEELEAVISGKGAPAFFRVDGFEIVVNDEEIAGVLRSLRPQWREIVLLAYFMGKSDAEISEDMKLTRSSVQRRRTSALAIMQKLMGGAK